MKTGLYAYGTKDVAYEIILNNFKFSFTDSCENEPFMKVFNYKHISLNNTEIKNFTGDSLIHSWSQGGELTTNNLVLSRQPDEMISYPEEPFTCSPI